MDAILCNSTLQCTAISHQATLLKQPTDAAAVGTTRCWGMHPIPSAILWFSLTTHEGRTSL